MPHGTSLYSKLKLINTHFPSPPPPPPPVQGTRTLMLPFGGRGGGGGSLGPHIKFGGKIWGKIRPSSPNKRKSFGSSVTTRPKSWEKIPILRSNLKFKGQNLGYLSPIFVETKFGAPTRTSETKHLRPPNMEVPSPPPLALCLGLVSTRS